MFVRIANSMISVLVLPRCCRRKLHRTLRGSSSSFRWFKPARVKPS